MGTSEPPSDPKKTSWLTTLRKAILTLPGDVEPQPEAVAEATGGEAEPPAADVTHVFAEPPEIEPAAADVDFDAVLAQGGSDTGEQELVQKAFAVAANVPAGTSAQAITSLLKAVGYDPDRIVAALAEQHRILTAYGQVSAKQLADASAEIDRQLAELEQKTDATIAELERRIAEARSMRESLQGQLVARKQAAEAGHRARTSRCEELQRERVRVLKLFDLSHVEAVITASPKLREPDAS